MRHDEDLNRIDAVEVEGDELFDMDLFTEPELDQRFNEAARAGVGGTRTSILERMAMEGGYGMFEDDEEEA